MTCYIYRETEKQLIGPFSSPDDAFEHREKIRTQSKGRPGRPRSTGNIIVSVEEAIKLCLQRDVKRVTPEQDVIGQKELERAA